MFRRDEDDNHVIVTISNSSQYQEFSWKGNWDAGADEIIEAFYSMMVGLTFPETTVLRAMKEFAEDRLEVLARDNKDEADD